MDNFKLHLKKKNWVGRHIINNEFLTIKILKKTILPTFTYYINDYFYYIFF